MLRTFCLILIGVVVVVCYRGYVNRPIVVLNGQFLTMDASNTVVTALGLRSDRILATGDPESVEARISGMQAGMSWLERIFGIRYVDLQGQVVLPGFVDAHSHFPSSGITGLGIDLSSPPFGKVGDIPTLLRNVETQSRHQSESRWIIGFNYDDSALGEQRHPTRTELDQAAPDHAVYLRHRSGHMGVANSRALSQLGHDPVDPPNPHSMNTDGLLREKAAPGMSRLLKEIPWWQLPATVFRARDEYLAAGVTTVQNGFADKLTLQLLRYASSLGLIPQRIVVWPAHDKLDVVPSASFSRLDEPVSTTMWQHLADAINWPSDDRSKVAIGAIKLIADGSPQGRTAWLSEPYLFDETLDSGYRGFPNIQRDSLHELIMNYHGAGFQLALHGNGDAAIESIIDGLQMAQSRHPREDARHIIVHAQTIRQAQLKRISGLGVSVSFFPTHTFYWGDWYRNRVLGEARAALISPMATADANDVRYTIHADSPVTPINPMQMLWSATRRLTWGGDLIGGDERVSRLRALRAMTIDAAWQNHLDNDRGSIEVGKLADFIVMSDNPLDIADVRNIDVRQVWIGGSRRFMRTP